MARTASTGATSNATSPASSLGTGSGDGAVTGGAGAGAGATGGASQGNGLGAPRYNAAERAYFEKMNGRADAAEGGADDPWDDDEPGLEAEGGVATATEDDDGDGEQEGEGNEGGEGAEQPAAEADPLDTMLQQAPTLLAVAKLQAAGVDKSRISSLLKSDPSAVIEWARSLGDGAPGAEQGATGGADDKALDTVLAEQVKGLVDVFGDEETAGKFAGPLKAVAQHVATQAQKSLAPIKNDLKYLTSQFEDLVVDLAAQSLAGEFKQLGTPEGVAAVRKAMLEMKPGKHASIKDWMRAAAGGAFGNARKQDIQRDMAERGKLKNNGQPSSPTQAAQTSTVRGPKSRDDYDAEIFLMRDRGESAEKIDAYKRRWGPTIFRGRP